MKCCTNKPIVHAIIVIVTFDIAITQDDNFVLWDALSTNLPKLREEIASK